MGATIFDVAKRAGVSIGTVSRVLNNRDRVHPETRQRVLAAIREMNYQANAFARGLASQQTKTLGLVIPKVNDPFYFHIVRGIEDIATSVDYSLLIASQPRHLAEHHYLQLFRRGHVDAMVLVAIDVIEKEVQQIVDRGVRIVLVQQDIGKSVPTLLIDNYQGGRVMTKHLLDHGYKRLAYIAGTDYTPDNRERLRGMRDVLSEQGLSLPAAYIAQGDFMPGSGYQAALQLLTLPERPEAIFAANDHMAVDAIKALQDRGLRVPEDIAVVGFDDISMANYVSPPLTTIRQPTYELGQQAAQMALIMLKLDSSRPAGAGQAREALRAILPISLVVRHSCGCTP
jgi:DNA-binding LacI/PurR family transcriptional regulator